VSIYWLGFSGDLVTVHTVQNGAVVPLEGSTCPYLMLDLHLVVCANHIWAQTSTWFHFILAAVIIYLRSLILLPREQGSSSMQSQAQTLKPP